VVTVAPNPVPVPTPTPTRSSVDCSAYRAQKARDQASRQAQSFNFNTQWNMALNSGDTAKAAQIMQQSEAAQKSWADQDAALAKLYPGC
jgi:hypothetical protein